MSGYQTTVTLILLAARHSHFKCTRSFNPSMVKMLLFAKFNVVSPWRRETPYIRSNWLCVTDSCWRLKILLQNMKVVTAKEQYIMHVHTHTHTLCMWLKKKLWHGSCNSLSEGPMKIFWSTCFPNMIYRYTYSYIYICNLTTSPVCSDINIILCLKFTKRLLHGKSNWHLECIMTAVTLYLS